MPRGGVKENGRREAAGKRKEQCVARRRAAGARYAGRRKRGRQ